MGLIRTALVTVLTILLFISLFSTAAFLTLSMSLDYDIIKPEIYTIVNDIILNQTDMDEQIDEVLIEMQIYCQNNTVFSQVIDDNDFFKNYTLEIPCEVINQGSDAVITHVIDDLVEKNYYKEYDCGFKDCFFKEGTPFFLLSQHTKNYFNSYFYISLVISLILVILLFFCMESKTSLPFLLGIVFIVLSFIFLGMGKILSLLVGWQYVQIISAFLTQAYTVFLIFFILGIISIGTGIVLKLLSIGRFFGKIFKKEENRPKKK